MSIKFLKYTATCFIIVFIGSCKADKEKKIEPDYIGFTIMNIFQSESFSFPAYYPLKDIEGKSNRLDSILKTSKLIFRFSEQNCDICIESEVKLINKLNISNHVVGLANYSNMRMLKLARKKYNIQFPLYHFPSGQNGILPEEKENLGKPYLFFMDTDLHAKFLFFPSMQHPGVSERYYEEILYLLNNSNVNKEYFDKKMADLGTINKGKTYKVKFEYTNRDPGSLVIKNINSSCGCTIPHWDKEPLAEGKSSELVVSFTPEAIGYNSKTIMVSHNKSKHPLRLIIKANVE